MELTQNKRKGLGEWYGVREIAKAHDVTHLTVYRAINAGRLKASRLGPKLWRAHKDDIARWRGEST
jgi:excisionase family DNA binding protein